MKRITTKELSDGLIQAKKNAEDLLKVYDSVLDAIRQSAEVLKGKINKIDLGDANDIELLNDTLKLTNDLLQEKIKIDKQVTEEQKKYKKIQDEEIKVKKTKIQLTDEEIKTQLKQRSIEAERVKQIKALIEIEKGEAKTLSDVRKQIIALKIARDSLDYVQDASEIATYNTAIDALNERLKENIDKQSQQTMKVGSYTESIKEALGENQDFGNSFGRLSQTFNIFNTSLNKTKNSTKVLIQDFRNAEGGVKKFSSGVKLAGNVLKGAGIGILVAGISAIATSFNDTESGAKAFAKVTQNLLNGFKFIGSYLLDYLVPTFGKIGNEAKILGLNIKESFSFGAESKKVRLEIAELENEQKKYNKQIDEFKNRDFKKELVDVSEATNKIIDAQYRLTEATQESNIVQAQRRQQEEILIALADDDTRGFNERTIARKKYNELATKEILASKEQLKIAKLERDSLKAQLELSRKTNANGEESLTLRQQLADAEVKYIDAQTQSKIKQIEVNQKLNKELFDEKEQALDLEIDGTDKVIEANLLKVESDKYTLEERRQILDETNKIIADSNTKTLNIIAETKKGLTGEDIRNAFTSSNDNLELFTKKLNDLGLAEIPINRVREIFIRLKTQIKDTQLSQEALNLSMKEFEALEKDIELQRNYLNGKYKNEEEYEQAIIDLKRQSLIEQIRNTKIGTVEELSLKKELNDLLIDEEKRKEAKLKEEQDKAESKKKLDDEKEKESIKQIRDKSIEASEAILNAWKKNSEKRQDELNKEIDQAKNRNDELLALTNSSNSQVSQIAADSLEKQRQIEREKREELQKELKKQQTIEVILAGLNSYKANAGQPNAAGRTLADIGVLITGLKALGSFKSGTDRLGKVDNPLDKDGGRPIIAHNNEMIIQEPLVEKMGFPSRYKVADIVTRFNDGDLIDKKSIGKSSINQILVNTDNSELVKEMQGIRTDINNSNQVSIALDLTKKMIKLQQRKGNRINEYLIKK